MELISLILVISQLFFTIAAGMYFYLSLKNQHNIKAADRNEYKKETQHLSSLRNIKLTRPLSESTRPKELDEIIGQKKGIKALEAALCGENPQHILIYGPSGVGKTAAARLILELAKKSKASPFRKDASFIEIDATTLQFDERSIADPLIGSVHDPIYQGSGILGSAGIPQPKEGAVSRAHGGVLFIDEIGELHSMQMNKLLKVLEDRCVFFSSSYYNPDAKNLPKYIKDIFENGIPADFRLIGATTRSPEEIPSALRSRCTEIFFDSLKAEDIIKIVENACKYLDVGYEEDVAYETAKYCANGRTAVNLIQTAYSYAKRDKRAKITVSDLREVVSAGRLSPRIIAKVNQIPKIGCVNALAVSGSGEGMLLGIEAAAVRVNINEKGSLKITGIIHEESIKSKTGSLKRKGTAHSCVEAALTVLEKYYGINTDFYNIHINFPGGMPVDGPSAGIAVFIALYSALFAMAVNNKAAMTGEIGIFRDVLPVGGVRQKLEAAKESGAELAIIPKENMQDSLLDIGIKIVPVRNISEAMQAAFSHYFEGSDNISSAV